MKKILLYLFLISAFLSCKKEEEAVYKNLEIDELESTILSFSFK